MVGNKMINNFEEGVSTYLQEISKYDVLTRAEETTLMPVAKAGDKESIDKVIRANLRFVVTISYEYKGRGMTLMDIISEGNLGLFRALESFDPTRGIRFITYAKWWIRQSIVYAFIYKGHLVRLPQSQLRKFNKVKDAINKLEDRLQRKPTGEEIANVIGNDDREGYATTNFPISQKSLNQPLTSDGKDSLIDVLRDEHEITPDKGLEDESFEFDMASALNVLREREIDILKKLYGINLQRSMTLGDVGNIYGISKERVRQIKEEALSKLRSSRVTENLRTYLS